MGKRSEVARVLAEIDAEIAQLHSLKERLVAKQRQATPLVRRERKPKPAVKAPTESV